MGTVMLYQSNIVTQTSPRKATTGVRVRVRVRVSMRVRVRVRETERDRKRERQKEIERERKGLYTCSRTPAALYKAMCTTPAYATYGAPYGPLCSPYGPPMDRPKQGSGTPYGPLWPPGPLWTSPLDPYNAPNFGDLAVPMSGPLLGPLLEPLGLGN